MNGNARGWTVWKGKQTFRGAVMKKKCLPLCCESDKCRPIGAVPLEGVFYHFVHTTLRIVLNSYVKMDFEFHFSSAVPVGINTTSMHSSRFDRIYWHWRGVVTPSLESLLRTWPNAIPVAGSEAVHFFSHNTLTDRGTRQGCTSRPRCHIPPISGMHSRDTDGTKFLQILSIVQTYALPFQVYTGTLGDNRSFFKQYTTNRSSSVSIFTTIWIRVNSAEAISWMSNPNHSTKKITRCVMVSIGKKFQVNGNYSLPFPFPWVNPCLPAITWTGNVWYKLNVSTVMIQVIR